jgi:ABC-type nitrate/sulfonate/bicarbonate transport system substrate-binding protein
MRSSLFVVFAFAVPTLAAAGPAPTTVRVCVPQAQEHVLALNAVIAGEHGFFKDEGLDVQISPQHDPGAAALGLMKRQRVAGMATRVANAEQCQIGVTTVESILSEGVMLAALRPMYVHLYGLEYDTNLVVSKSSGVKSVRDLKGKHVRLGQPATYIALSRILAEEGLTLDDVVIDDVPPTQVLERLREGTLAAAITYFPSMSVLLASGEVAMLRKDILGTYVLPYVPNDIMVANDKFAHDNPEVLAKVQRAMRRANEWVRRNPADLVHVAKRYYTEKLGLTPWDVDPILIERSADFFGDLQFPEAYERSVATAKADSSVMEALTRYRTLLLENGFPAGPETDLRAWSTYEIY